MTKAERTLLCAVADLLLMIEPRGYVEGTDIGKARARLERARVSLEAEGLMGRVTLTPEAAGQIAQMIRRERGRDPEGLSQVTTKFSVTDKVGASSEPVHTYPALTAYCSDGKLCADPKGCDASYCARQQELRRMSED